MIDTVLDDDPHALDEEHSQKNGDVGGCHLGGCGDHQGRDLGKECQHNEDDTDNDTHSSCRDSGDFGQCDTG